MAQLYIQNGFIGSPGGIDDTFIDFPFESHKNTVRSYTVVPLGSPETGGLPDFDQQAEITEVYEILKGSNHAATGEAGNLQEHVVVLNKQGGLFGLTPPFLLYEVWVVES